MVAGGLVWCDDALVAACQEVATGRSEVRGAPLPRLARGVGCATQLMHVEAQLRAYDRHGPLDTSAVLARLRLAAPVATLTAVPRAHAGAAARLLCYGQDSVLRMLRLHLPGLAPSYLPTSPDGPAMAAAAGAPRFELVMEASLAPLRLRNVRAVLLAPTHLHSVPTTVPASGTAAGAEGPAMGVLVLAGTHLLHVHDMTHVGVARPLSDHAAFVWVGPLAPPVALEPLAQSVWVAERRSMRVWVHGTADAAAPPLNFAVAFEPLGMCLPLHVVSSVGPDPVWVSVSAGWQRSRWRRGWWSVCCQRPSMPRRQPIIRGRQRVCDARSGAA
jgi:hypothetical protein